MHYLIQSNLLRNEHKHHELIEILERHNLSHEFIAYKPFSDVIEIQSDRKDIFVFGSVSMTNAARKYGWNPGVFYNDNHDMEVYMKHYGEHMLNSEGQCIKFFDKLPENLPFVFFARPTRDTKIFSGGLFTQDAWYEWVNTIVDNSLTNRITDETRIFVAPCKSYIYKEIRCFVVDGKVITTSVYKVGARVNYYNCDHEQEAIDFAQKMVNIFSPSRAFVLDICLVEEGYKVVEINCINCSGFYDIDMFKLIQSLENMGYE